ncbi:MAG: hypothetical protein HRU14_14020 [Planctomycetes bacterium]|nr:hypothetical protein [Planctomycetota bacterium]
MKIPVAVLVLALALPSQQVTVNGLTGHVDVPLLSTLALQLTGPAGLPHHWGISTDPGPSNVLGVTVPLGITPGLLDLGMGTPMHPTGMRTWSVAVPLEPALVDLTAYMAALFLDPSAPSGVLVTNGVSFTLTGTADAGPDVATFVNDGTVLSGAGNRDPFTGMLPPGTTFQWLVVSGPAGAAASLDESQSEFPSFTADTPGMYTLEAQVAGPTILGTDTCDVYVYDFRWNHDRSGDFVTAFTGMSGTAVGPPGWSVSINGTPVTLVFGDQWFGGVITPTGVMETVVAELTTPGGQKLRTARPITVATGLPLSVPVSQSVGVRLRSGGLDGLEPLIETELANLDYNSIVTSIGTINAVNGAPLFSANITPTSGSLSTSNIEFELTPDNGHVDIAVTFHNVHVDVDVTGVLVFVSYSDQASIDASSATMTGELTFTPSVTGALEIQLTNVHATLNNFNFTLSGFLNGLVQIGFIQDAIRDTVESSLESTAPDIVAYINPLLSDFAFNLDLSQYGIPVQVEFPMDTAFYDIDGVTLCNTSRALPLSIGPESPPLDRYRESSATALTFPLTTTSGVSYGFSLCINDDLFNQLLAAFVASGTLDLDITGMLGTGAQAITLTAGFMHLLVPGFGFGKLDPNMPLTLRLRHRNAPVVEFTPGQSDHGKLHIGGVRIDIEAEPQPGVFLPVASVSVSGTANVSLTVAAGTTEVGLAIDGNSIATTFFTRREMAGSNPGPALQGLSFLMQFLLPSIVEPLAVVTIPAPPIGMVSVLGVTGSTAWSDYMCAYFNVQ